MKIKSVSLKTSEKFPGDLNGLPMKAFKNDEKTEVHLVGELLIVVRKGQPEAMAFHVSGIERMVLSADDALSLITDPRPPKRAA